MFQDFDIENKTRDPKRVWKSENVILRYLRSEDLTLDRVLVQSKVFWRRPVTLWWTLSIVRNSEQVEDTKFRKLDLFLSSNEGRETPTLLGSLEIANLNHRSSDSDSYSSYVK
jgi:hypothetical protein